MENFKPKPELKPKQESDRCKRLRVGLHDEFRADKLVRFTPELRAKGKVLSEEFGKLYTKEKGISFEEWFKKIKMFDRKEGVTEFRVLHEQERLNKLKDSKRIKRAMSEKNKQKEVIKKGSKPGNAQADNEITKNANPEESVDAKEPEEADPKKTKAEQKNQELELEEEEAFQMGDADEDKNEDEAEEGNAKPEIEKTATVKKSLAQSFEDGDLELELIPETEDTNDTKDLEPELAEEENAEPNQEPEIIPEVENIDDEKITEPNQEPEIAQDIKKLKAEQEDRVLGALDQAISFIEKTQEEKRTEQEKWIIETIGDSWLKMNEDGKILVGGSDGFGNGNKKFIKYEGIPVDELIDYLKKRYSGNSKETEKLKKVVKILEDNSVPFHSDSAEELDERIKLEGYYISQEENYRKKTSQEENYFEGKKALSKRRELVFLTEEQIRASIKANHTNKTQKKEAQEDIDQLDAGNISKSGDEELKQETAKKQKTEELKQETVEVDDELDEIIGKTELDKTGIIREQEKTVEIDDELDEIIGKTELDKTKIESETNPEPEENEELEILKKAVEQARDQFVRINTEVTSAYLKIKRTLGKIFSKDPGEVPDVKNSYLAYQEKVKELKNFKLDAIKDKYAGISALSEEEKIIKTAELKKELGDLMLEFNFEEKINLYNARTTAGAEVRKDQLGGKALAKSAEWVNRYRKLNWKYKIAISAVLLAGGYAAAMVGATGVGAGILAVNIGRRVVGGAAAGMGTAGLLETIARGSQKKQADKDTATMFGELDEMDKNNELAGLVDEDANWEEKFFVFEQKLDEEINGYKQSLKREKGSAELRLLAGLSVGVFVGSGAAGQVFKYFYGVAKDVSGYGMEIMKKACGNWEEKVVAVLGVTDPLNDLHESSVAGVEVEKPDMAKTNLRVGPLKPDANTTDFKMPDNKIPTEKLIPGSIDEMVDGDSRLHPNEVPNNPNIKELKINGSIERTIIRQLQEQGIPKAQAGKLADIWTHDYVKNYNLGHPKTPITFESLNHVQPVDDLKLNIDPNNLSKSGIISFERASDINLNLQHTNIPHTGGVADNIKMNAISEQMEKEASEREFNNKITGSSGRSAEIDTRIAAQMNQEEISRKFNDQLFGKAKTIDINPENMPDPRGGLMPDTSISDFSELDSHMDKFPDNMSDTSSANLENIESNLADGARGADNSVADFSLQDNHIDNVADIQGIEISLAEKVNIEKIADIFDSSLFSGNSLSQQMLETKNLKGVDFYRAYREIYTKIINNTFSENGIIGQDANEYLERSSNSKIDALIKYNSDHFGTQSVEPKSGENMGAWMTRMVDRALGSCGIGLNNGQIKV
ncbi:MAG: hypothetical protein WCK16_01295 [Candidatus Moraniibacteriota bacterium]